MNAGKSYCAGLPAPVLTAAPGWPEASPLLSLDFAGLLNISEKIGLDDLQVLPRSHFWLKSGAWNQRKQLWRPGGKQKIPPSDLSLPQLRLRHIWGSTQGLTPPCPGQEGGHRLEGALPSPQAQDTVFPGAPAPLLAGSPAARLTRASLPTPPPRPRFIPSTAAFLHQSTHSGIPLTGPW